MAPGHSDDRDAERPVVGAVRRLLVIAYHFPPFAGSSGVQRTLRFVQHLPRHGWQPVVLTCQSRAYEAVNHDQVADIPPDTVVERAFALDSGRHLAVAGWYPGWLARPDRWVSWWPAGVLAGRRLIRRYKPAAIFSTYPIATAHLIGHSLARRSGLPWIADFRDPMAQEGYPGDSRTWASFKRLEEDVFGAAAACTFTTPGAANAYRERYPESRARITVIENGYDEETFEKCVVASSQDPLHPGAVTILHSGIVYPEERDPTQLFVALRRLKEQGLDGKRLRIRFRAAAQDTLLGMLAERHAVVDMVEIGQRVAYREALREMLRADGLLVLQAANCNAQVPAKLYEYLRARRPILALTDPTGDTANVLRASGIDAIAPLDDASAIAELLHRFAGGWRHGTMASEAAIMGASRAHRTEQLAELLEQLCPPRE